MTHRCKDYREMYCYKCLFEREDEYKKLMEFVEKIAYKSHEFEEISHASWDASLLLKEIGELK